MRKILFRGQTRKYGEKVRVGDGEKIPGNWVYGGVLQGIGAHSVIYGGKNDDNFGEGFQKWCVHTDTLGQYTGSTDKNGKKIFEGDIVRFDNGIFVVVFYDNRIGFGFRGRFGRGLVPGFTMANWEHIEVIGNIHDNPELLEVSEDG